jgi:hypothetical protein
MTDGKLQEPAHPPGQKTQRMSGGPLLRYPPGETPLCQGVNHVRK